MNDKNEKNKSNERKENKWKNRLINILIALMIASPSLSLIAGFLLDSRSSIQKVSYDEFIKDVNAGNVDTVYYNESDDWMTYILYNDDTRTMNDSELEKYTYTNSDKRKVQYPGYDTFRKDMLEKGVKLKNQKRNNFSLIGIILPLILIWLIVKMIYELTHPDNGSSSGLSDISSMLLPDDSATKNLVQTSDVKFTDVIGLEETIEDVKFIADLLKNKELGADIGAKVPKGILLSGEPGTGKTLIAKAIAGEAGVPFLYVNSSSLIDRFVGVGARNVRKIFETAKKSAPCIIFFDEIDSIGVQRDSDSNSEREQTINALLQEMDGFTGREGIFIIAATNRADKLDKALMRSGRFDRQIVVNKPKNWEERKQLFDFYLKNMKVSDDVDSEVLAKQSSGFTGADIAAICNEAGIVAIMHKKSFVDKDCMEEAIDKKVFKGNRSKKEHFAEDKKIVAYHEAGHAVMHYLLNEPIARASIIGTTSGVGGVVFGEDKDTQFMTKEYYENRIKICYAGRASEQIKFNSVTQGASSDITQATSILNEYVSKLGFEEEFGLIDMDILASKQIIDKSNAFDLIQKKSKELYTATITRLCENYYLVEALANKLLKVETIDGEDIKELLDQSQREHMTHNINE